MNITWTISALNVKPADGDYADVVVTAHWQCMGVDGEYTGSVYSTCGFPLPEGNFTPYADLTQEQVLGWIWANGVDKDVTEAAVQAQIESQINPPVVTPPLPW
jgi:hypothetical protein